MIKLFEILNKTGITLKPITAAESRFGESYTSPYVKGPHKFANILVYTFSTVVGEIEYGDVDENTLEILSIHINKEHRSKGYAQQAINQLVTLTKKNTVILKASPSSKGFWVKFGFTKIPNTTDYYTKTF